MRGEAFRVVAALAIAALLALGIPACGGGEDSSTTAASTPADATAPDRGSRPEGTSGSQRQGDEGGEPVSGGNDSAGADVDAAPLKVSGGGSEQVRVEGGDNSIQEYGEEDEDSLAEAAEVVHGFYVARAEEDWAKACSYLAKSMVEQLEELPTRAGERGKTDCPTLLKTLTPPLSPSVRREATIIDAVSLRVDGERSFLIYRGAERTVYAMPLEDESGVWKLTLLSATPLG